MRTTACIQKANNYMVVKDYNPSFVKEVIRPFCARYLYKVGTVPIPGTNQKKKVVTHVFARMNNDQSEVRMSIGLYEMFMNWLQTCGYNPSRVKIEDVPVIKAKKVNFEWAPGWGEPRDNQKDWVDYQLAEGPLKINNAQTGFGKAAPLDSLVLTPSGWRFMGDLKVGDEVIAKDGTVSKILGVFPQGKLQCYDMVFEDGRVAESVGEHLWDVFDCSRGVHIKDPVAREKDRWKTIDTNEVIRKLGLHNPRLYIPLFEGHEEKEVSHLIDPYLMGVLIGNGEMTSGNIVITKDKKEVISAVNDVLPPGIVSSFRNDITFALVKDGDFDYYSVYKTDENIIKNELVRMGLHGRKSEHKFIPDEYMHGTLEQRFSLLQGLMDTDGYVTPDSNTSYSTSSKELAEQIQKLVWSIGGIAKISSRIPTFTHKGEKKEGLRNYNVSIRYKDPAKLVRAHPLKVERARKTQYSDALKLRIKEVRPSRVTEAQCIMIDHPDHLYVMDNYIVTHNTFMATHTLVNQGERGLVTCLPRYLTIWINNFNEKLVLSPEDVMVVDTSELEILAETISTGKAEPKIIILPLTRIMIYLQRTKDDPTLPCLDTIYEMCGIGLRIMDESHESIHQVYISMLFGNFSKTIALSATITGDDALINSIYGYIFPKKWRHKDPEYRKYIDVYAYWHSIDMGRYRIKTKGFGGYSHMYFEKSIMKTPKLFNYYAELAVKAFKEFYLEHEDYEPGQRCLFFFYTVEMCKRMMAYFKEKFPDMDIVKYTNDESKNKELVNSYAEHDVVFTTAKSCGTGKDIPKLFVVFSPLSVSSSQQNNQMLGRLRDVSKWWNKTPKFVFWVCSDIEKQREYSKKRKECFANKSLSFTNINSYYHLAA